MLDILAITTPIYLIILTGFLMTRKGLFSKADMRLLGRFVIQLALPALVFQAVSARPIGDIFNPAYMLPYLIGSLLSMAIGYGWARRQGRLDMTASTFRAMGVSCSNSGFVGYPILLLSLAPVAGMALAMNMVVENLVMIPLLLVMAEHGRGGTSAWRSFGQSMRQLARHPLFIAMAAAVAVSLTGVTLPAPLTQTIRMFAAASGALSLFVIGGTLVGLPWQGMARQALPTVVGKLVLHPLMVLLCILALPLIGQPMLDPTLRTAAVILAAVPMLGIYPTLAQQYGQENFCASALLLTTIVSFFTLSLLLWVQQHLPALI